MPTTSIYGLPYQGLEDPPHGPDLGRDLAEAVETELVRVDADIASITTVGSALWTDYGTPSTVWTSTLTQPAIGNGAVTARYKRIGGPASKTVAFRIKILPGTTTTYGTGNYQFLLPVAIADEQVAVGIFRDNSGAVEYGGFSAWLQSGTLILSVRNSAAAVWSNSVPVGWATGDRAEISGVYEAA